MIRTILPQSSTTEPNSSSPAVSGFSRNSYSSPRSSSPSPRSSKSLCSDLSRSPSPVHYSRSLSEEPRSPSPGPIEFLSSSGEHYSVSEFPGYRPIGKPSPIRTRTVPAISVRPARVSSSVNPRVLNRLRKKVAAQLDDSVLSHNLLNSTTTSSGLVRTSKSADTSPNLRRSNSLRAVRTKFCRTGSDGLNGYEPIAPDTDDILIPRERIVPVSRAIKRKGSSKHYRPMSLIPAANQIIHYDSMDEGDGESSLDFANVVRGQRVSEKSLLWPLIWSGALKGFSVQLIWH